MISARRLVSSPTPPRVLDEVSLAAQQGECLSVVAYNRRDVTMLLQVLAGLRAPHSGSVHLRDDAAAASSSQLRRAVAYATLALVPAQALTVGEYLQFAVTVRAVRPRVTASDAAARMGLEPGASLLRLSVGDRAGLAIAAALMLDTPVAIVDIDVDALGTRAQRALDWLSDARAAGTAIILAGADAAHAPLHPRVLRLQSGQIAEAAFAVADGGPHMAGVGA